MKIGIIGAGQIGSTLARKFSAAGHAVKLANSRGPETLAELASQIGVAAASARDAVRDVDVVIISVPLKSVPELPRDLFDGVPDDVVVIDTGNYYPIRDGRIDAIEDDLQESLWVSRQIGRPVTKAFNSIFWTSLANEGKPAGSPGRIALPVAGDDARAKAVALELVDVAGFDGIDAGTIDESWRQQPGTPTYCTDYDAEGVRKALRTAVRALAPVKRDESFEKFAQLSGDFEPKMLIDILRSISKAGN
ncbi:hypothetical protein A0J57_03980 [Sphingobium sp. 22B]|nr:hypothetical protein AXW74_00530 [Sphingobium sp. AM]KYC33753.1 hypothetical protein A0J57_03980 [Sphingobium sp. 22B]OAP33491.1 hypothetical protein A8O16_03200 [Sphingobium sp. 20006FA]